MVRGINDSQISLIMTDLVKGLLESASHFLVALLFLDASPSLTAADFVPIHSRMVTTLLFHNLNPTSCVQRRF